MSTVEKITAADLEGKGVTPLPDVPEMTSEQLKYRFEEIVRDVAIAKINEIIDAIYAGGLPVATSNAIGGVKAAPAESSDVQVVRIGEDGMLYTGGAVQSVNGQTGAVVLNAEDVGALPDNTDIPTALADLAEDAEHRTVTDTQTSQWDGKYDKPTDGIPKTDLASGVQSALDAGVDATARLTGTGAPTTATVGRVGDLYTATATGKGYRCTAVSGSTYTWEELGAGSSPFTGYNGAGLHNSIYRGKYLGNALTDTQSEAIRAGTFDDLWIGDYWTIDGVNYRIADFDYCLHSGDTELTTHHAVIVTDTILYNAQMNTTDTIDGGYAGSTMRMSGLNTAKSTITTAFGDHVLVHREVLSNAVSNGSSAGWAWYDSTVELLS